MSAPCRFRPAARADLATLKRWRETGTDLPPEVLD